MWRRAGLERSPEDLAELLRDEHPLARLVATCALAREESRGAHRRTDRPDLRPDLDLHHTIVRASGEVRLEPWE
jgi:aspartate oxidase